MIVISSLGSSIDIKNLRTGSLGILALFILSEKQKQQSSSYYTYIYSLPDIIPGILGWNSGLLLTLRYYFTSMLS